MSEQLETRERVLEAACELFAQKGYRETTVQEICDSAQANVAAVNYYYGSKKELYRAVWDDRFGFIRAMIEDMRASDRAPTDVLADYIRRRIEHLFVGCVHCQMPMIVQREMANPSEIHDELRDRYLKPNVEFLVDLVARVLGMPGTDLVARHAAFCIHGQLISLAMVRRFDGPMSLLFDEKPPGPDDIERLVDHVTWFVRGGLRDVAKKAGVR